MKYVLLILFSIIFIFTGLCLPFINNEYGLSDSDNYDTSAIQALDGDASLVTLGNVTFSIISMFFWSFGALPLPIEAIYLVFRVVFWFILVDTLWI